MSDCIISEVVESNGIFRAETAEGGRGVCSTNRPPANLKRTAEEVGGEDRAVLSLYVDWCDVTWKTLSKSLDDAKKHAQEGVKDLRDFVDLGDGLEVQVMPTGRKAGGSTGPMYIWQVMTRGRRFAIGRMKNPVSGVPNVIVDVSALELMRNNGLMFEREILEEIIGRMGGVIQQIKVSRVDMCVDLPGVDTELFVKKLLNRSYVCRATKQSFYREHDRWTGFSIGTGIMLRVYDKLLESQSGDPEKFKYLIDNRWGGVIPKYATRVEFQLKSEELRDFQIVTLEDYLKKRYFLGEYLTNQWFRMLENKRTDKHSESDEVWKVWREVSSRFERWTGYFELERVERKKRKNPDYEALQLQAVGCITSAAIVSGYALDQVDEFFQFAMETFSEVFQEHKSEIMKRAFKKCKEYEMMVPA